jgi:phosphate transport system substrate-binding protein
MEINKSEKSARSDVVLVVTVCLFIVLLGTLVRAGEIKPITIKGSDTMVHLVSNWAEAFMKLDPNVEVAVTGGGSGTGIAALINGTTEVCASSRDMKEKEKQQARGKGVEVKEVVVARDGIAVVVNPKNPVSSLDMGQLEQMFTGVITRWNQVGGGNEEILVFSRESSSGTYVFFQEHVLKNKDYTPKAKLMAATSAIIESVSVDKGAIGYVGLGYALAAKDKVKIVAVKADANSPAVMPSDATVISGRYSIARPLYLYVASKASVAVQDFVKFCLSDTGQAIVRESGYVTIK